jgi:hypothetical protein
MVSPVTTTKLSANATAITSPTAVTLATLSAAQVITMMAALRFQTALGGGF